MFSRILIFLPMLLWACGNSPDIQPERMDGANPPTPTQNTEEDAKTPPTEKVVDSEEPAPENESTPPNLTDNPGPLLLLKEGEGLASENSVFRAKITWAKGPRKNSYSIADITIADMEGNPPQHIEVIRIWPYMKIHGHGTGNIEAVVTQHETKFYEFHVTNLFFIMKGPWEMNLRVIVNGAEDFLEIPIEVKE